jgi:hypothetical protein
MLAMPDPAMVRVPRSVVGVSVTVEWVARCRSPPHIDSVSDKENQIKYHAALDRWRRDGQLVFFGDAMSSYFIRDWQALSAIRHPTALSSPMWAAVTGIILGTKR